MTMSSLVRSEFPKICSAVLRDLAASLGTKVLTSGVLQEIFVAYDLV